MATAEQELPQAKKRAWVSQTDVPRLTLNEALRVGRALDEHYARQATKPLRIAEALEMSPNSGPFRSLTSASAAYGLTNGAAWASEISLTPLGRRVFSPTSEGDDAIAKREAALKPRIIREFLTRYDNAKFPADNIAFNVLEELGVPRDATKRVFGVIRDNAEELGLFREINSQLYVDLQASDTTPHSSPAEAGVIDLSSRVDEQTVRKQDIHEAPRIEGMEDIPRNPHRVFITHGNNRAIVDQLKELLVFGNFEPVVAIEKETTAKPVPDKVLDEMRSCGAAIVHVGAEQKALDSQGTEIGILNSNVLIEIGAALALYRNRFILLVEEGVSLPSNLQGLYQVKYTGNKLDYEATMRLLKAFNEFKGGGA